MFGDVYICEFPITSAARSKIRPVLVLFDLKEDAIICRVTSVLRTELLDIALDDWRAAGLLKPSVVRLGHLVTAENQSSCGAWVSSVLLTLIPSVRRGTGT